MPTDLQQLADALERHDLDQADAIVARLSPVPHAALGLAAELHLRRRRWREAALLLGRIDSPDAAVTLKLHLSRNLAALQQHRPHIYERMVALKRSERYRFVAVKDGRLTIADCRDPQRPCILTPNQDPAASITASLKQLGQALQMCWPIGLCGVGDGYLLAVLAKQASQHLFNRQQVVHLFEPDEQLLFACLMLHDYSQPNGPIAQPRFQWFVGEQWESQFSESITNDLMLLPPNTLVPQSVGSDGIAQGVKRVGEAFGALSKRLHEQANETYGNMSATDFTDRFTLGHGSDQSQNRDRPRVLLLTTRFSSVLQYATRDAAEGFRQNGWDARVVIEAHPWQMMSDMAVRRELIEFRPDLVFQIDHLRSEHGSTVPPQVPFACWIQDHLTNLTTAEAGRKVGLRDYVLTFASPLFVDQYEYPARQCVDMPMMLTRGYQDTNDRVTVDHGAGDDLVYVSNVSGQPDQLLPQMLSVLPAKLHAVTEAAAERVLAQYADGRALHGHEPLRRLLDEVCKAADCQLSPDEHERVVDQLWNPLNITLYRQQALAWVAQAANELGLKLGIFGRGWEAHPTFVEHARGVIEHGAPLAALTRRTPLNLNLEPYVCFTHHRLLDGLSADGFFLVREHPGNTALQTLLNLLEANDVTGETLDEARQQLPVDAREQLEALLDDAACGVFDPSGDPVRQVRCMQRAGVLIPQPEGVPRLTEISFNDAATCRQLIERFIADPDARRAIVETQRAKLVERSTFKAGMRHVIQNITRLLKEEAKEELNQGGGPTCHAMSTAPAAAPAETSDASAA